MPKYIYVRQREGVMKQWLLFRNRKTMWQMIREVFKGHYKMSALTILIIILALVYVVSPIDLIPDRFLFVGWIDDAIIVFFAFKRLQFETHRFIRYKAAERRRGN